MSPESISQLARQNKPEKPEKSQEDLRNALEKHLFSLKPTIEEEAKKYKEALESDVFEDEEGELEGSGEKRKEEMQNRIKHTAYLNWQIKTSRSELLPFEFCYSHFEFILSLPNQ